MSFQYFQEIDLYKARELMVCAVQTYLNEINSSEAIRLYLANYPFTAKNVEIRIFPRKPDGHDPELGNIICVSARKGFIEYYVSVPNKYSRRQICRETYQEAVAKLKSST